MPVNDHDELLTRADKIVESEWGPVVVKDLIADLAAALRAALAAQPQACFEGEIVAAGKRDDGYFVTIRNHQPGRFGPDDYKQVVVYPAAAGSATPTQEEP